MSFFNRTFLILILTFATGFSGLVYEVSWQAYLANLIGSQARSAALVVAVFLGGLSFGYYLFGRISKNRSARKLIFIYGFAEIAIGFWAIIFPKLFISISNLLTQFPTGLFGDCLVSLILMAPPTILMGGTLPLLTQALSRSIGESAPLHARIYAVNTAGAFLGTIIAGFYLLPQFGLPVTVLLMGVVNLIAGISMLLIGREAEEAMTNSTSSAEVTEVPKSFTTRFIAILSVSLLSGFISISVQMVVMRLIGLSAGASQYAFSMAVGAFILLLAVGAWRLSSSSLKPLALWLNLSLVSLGLLIILITVPYWPYCSHVIRILLTNVPPNFYIFHLILFISFSFILLCAVGAFGNTLPTLFRLAQTDYGSLGKKVGALYALNTIGCVLGAVIGGYLALFYLDFFNLLRLLIVANLIATLIAIFKIDHVNKTLPIILVSISLFALVLVPAWPIERLSVGTFRMRTPQTGSFSGAYEFYRNFLSNGKILAYKDDPNTTVAVRQSGESLSIYVNGKSDGSTTGSDRITTKLLAHLPLLFRRSPAENAAVIGFGTGITAGTVANYETIKNVDVIEIAHFIKEFAALFNAHNGEASKNSKINWRIEDAYRYLTSTNNRYDLIISEPSNPWVAGVERLYAQEFYTIAKNRLTKFGVYAQWFHSYSVSNDTLALVLNTFSRSWPYVKIFAVDMDLILLGSEAPFDQLVIDNARQVFNQKYVSDDLGKHKFSTLESVAATEIMIPKRSFEGAGIQLLEFPKLSYQAGYDFFLDSMSPAYSLAEDPRWRGDTFLLWNDSLLSYLTNQLSESERLKNITHFICRLDSDKRASSKGMERECQRAEMASEVLFKDANSISVTARSLKRLLAEGPLPEAAKSISEASNELSAVTKFISPWLKFSIKNLTTRATPCFQSDEQSALSCRLQVAQIAHWQGDKAARDLILSSIPKGSLSEKLRESFESLLLN